MIIFLTPNEYHDIQYISDFERQIIWEISQTYNYIEPKKYCFRKKRKKNIETGRVTPWEDFNKSTLAWNCLVMNLTS